MPSRTGSSAFAPSRVLARRRQEMILDRLRERGGVRVGELVEMLGVSDMTVRRDLDLLAESGLLEKVHGGATAPPARSTDEPGFEANSGRRLEQKRAIADAAAQLVMPGSAIGLTAGTTTWQMAHLLADIPGLTIVTNSIRIADVLHLSAGPGATVVLTGGVRTPSDALVGPVAVASLKGLHLDVVVMGVHGMGERSGFTTPNLLEAEMNRSFVTSASRLVVTADSTKWGVTGMCSIAALANADAVITDDEISTDAHRVLLDHVDQVIVADTHRSGPRRGSRHNKQH